MHKSHPPRSSQPRRKQQNQESDCPFGTWFIATNCVCYLAARPALETKLPTCFFQCCLRNSKLLCSINNTKMKICRQIRHFQMMCAKALQFPCLYNQLRSYILHHAWTDDDTKIRNELHRSCESRNDSPCDLLNIGALYGATISRCSMLNLRAAGIRSMHQFLNIL